MAKKKPKEKPGPEPDRLKLEGDWKKAVEKAVRKKRPEGGWPEPEKKKPEDDESPPG